ncbi:MAG TPA: phosphoglucosamine mutase, partial [Geomobilimonas sp.]|nr:phosphoglucosamine mutase [Geomobilimonas sp.]
IMTIPEVATMIRGIEEKVQGEGRVLIRYSGTEPLLRIMLEGQDKYEITTWAKEIADLVESKIGGK